MANVPLASRVEVTQTVGLWLIKFKDIPDDLFYTAIMLCLETSKMFPTVAEIKQAIRELHYDKQTNPKRIAWDVKRDDKMARKVFEMANGDRDTGKLKETFDIVDLEKYAKFHIPDISEQLVRKNYIELIDGQKCAAMCWNCRVDKNSCITNGWVIKHTLDENGWVKNEWAKCQKIVK